MTELQNDAVVHNWNKAQLVSFSGLCLRIGWGYDKRLTMRQKGRIAAIRTILDDVLHYWEEETK